MSTAPPTSFGRLELAAACAFLVIVLGLGVSLARFVRATSADQSTRQILRQLDFALRKPDAKLDEMIAAITVPEGKSEAAWAEYARQSNAVVRGLIGVSEPVSDAWGNPIGFLAFERKELGMALHDQPFCFSPGPDGQYLTQDDNLYSYEQGLPRSPVPGAGGHGE